MTRLEERNENLWLLIVSPTIWALHFLACYVTAAIWCAKQSDPDGSVDPLRWTLAVFTVLALAGIGITGLRANRAARLEGGRLPFDEDTPEDRHRFLGFSNLLLSLLSAVAVIFAAFVVIFFKDCR